MQALGPLILSWRSVLAPGIVALTAVVTMLVGSGLSEDESESVGWIALTGLVAAAIASLAASGDHIVTFGGSLIIDDYTAFFYLLIPVCSAVVVLFSFDYVAALGLPATEYYALLLFATTGMMLMAGAGDLIVMFLGLETMSISAYVMAAMAQRDPKSSEAGLKYFLLGAFSTGFLLYGIALLYGATGSIKLEAVAQMVRKHSIALSPFVLLGLGLILVGFGFKVAAAPFHVWTPDAYEGAPTSVTALMAVGIKLGAFAGFIRVLLIYLAPLHAQWSGVLWALAALSMTVGNLAALAQENIKRMLAYSAIAHAGYILVGMTAGRSEVGPALLYYLLGYAFANLGAFAVLVAVEQAQQSGTKLDDLSGLARNHPMLAAAMALFMLSLMGMPPLAGFVGKFYIFSVALESRYVWLVIIATLNSVVSAYYYARVIVAMYMREGAERQAQTRQPTLLFALAVAALATVIIGLLPHPYISASSAAYASAEQVLRPATAALQTK